MKADYSKFKFSGLEVKDSVQEFYDAYNQNSEDFSEKMVNKVVVKDNKRQKEIVEILNQWREKLIDSIEEWLEDDSSENAKNVESNAKLLNDSISTYVKNSEILRLGLKGLWVENGKSALSRIIKTFGRLKNLSGSKALKNTFKTIKT